MKHQGLSKLLVVTLLFFNVFVLGGDASAAFRRSRSPGHSSPERNRDASSEEKQGIHGKDGFGRYLGVGINFGGGASKNKGAGIFSVFGRFGLHKFFNEQSKKPSFYLAGDVFINLGVFSIVGSDAYFMPVVGINIKPGVAFGGKKEFQAYGIVGIESMFLTSSPFQGFLLFDIGGGFKYDIAPKIALFAELKIAPTMVAYGSLGGYEGGDPTFISFNIGADFRF